MERSLAHLEYCKLGRRTDTLLQNHIREAYWAAVDGPFTNLDQQHAGVHVRHCIDYLRQSLLCHADANLEMPNMEAGGVTGFGFERQCRDIKQLRAWAEEWRVPETFQDS